MKPKFSVGDRVQVIDPSGALYCSDTTVTRVFFIEKDQEINIIQTGKSKWAKHDHYVYYLSVHEGTFFEHNLRPYPDEKPDPAYESMVNGLVFDIGGILEDA